MKDVILFPFYRWRYRLVLKVTHFCNCRAVSSSDCVYQFHTCYTKPGPYKLRRQKCSGYKELPSYLWFLDSLPMCVWNRASPHTKQFYGHQQDAKGFKSILTHLPRDSVKFYRLRAQCYKTTSSPPTSDVSPKASLSPVLLINWL